MSGGDGRRRTLLVLAAAALCAGLLAFAINLASSLVPGDWAERHATWIWIAAVGLIVLTGVLAVFGARTGDTEVAGPGVQGPTVIAGDGATVTFISREAAPAPSAAAGQVVVGELPGAPPALVAREAVERVAEVFASGGRVAAVSALSGGRGAGKTQVAAEYARRTVDEGVPLVAWVSAEDRDSLVTGLAEVARAIGVDDPEGDSEKSAKRLRDALAVRTEPAVLVLDNATDPVDVRRYVPTTGSTRVIVTSTDRAFGALGTEIDIGVFDRAQSLAYLAERTGLDDAAGADALAEELGDLPLALAQAATVIRLRQLSYREYLDRLHELPLEDILPPDRGDAYPHGVARAILLAIQAAEDADESGLTARILSATALLSSDGVAIDVMTAVVDAEGVDVEDALARLVERSLLVWARDARTVVMHRLVARAARDRLERTGELLHTFDAVATNLRGLLVPEDRAWEHRDRVDLVGHAVSVWDTAVGAGDRRLLSTEDLVGFLHPARWAVRHLRATADLSRAIEVGASVTESCERLLGADHLATLLLHNDLAQAYESAGDLPRAISLFEDALSALERTLGSNRPITLTLRGNLAHAYKSAGDLPRATPLLEGTLATRERILGRDHPDTLTSRNNLAGAYESAGDLPRAIALYEANLAARERVLGLEHPDTLTSRNNLAYACKSAGDLLRAIPLYEATLAARERVLGADHPQTLSSRNNLAAAYDLAGDLPRAIALHEDTLTAGERVLGPDHPHTLSSRNNLANAYRSAGDLRRAIPLYEANMAASDRILGSDHPGTLRSRNNLAGAYESAGDLPRAITLHVDTLAATERVLGPDHPDALGSRNNLAAAYMSAGDIPRAIDLFEEALGRCERVLAPDHPTTALVRANLAAAKSKA